MIDPTNITNFNRTEAELQEFLLFGICVAGKNSDIQAEKLDQFLNSLPQGTPFEKIRYACEITDDLEERMRDVKLGKYYLLVPAFTELAFSDINLQTCSHEELEDFTGIGPKTSRFFILHTRDTLEVACLDVHILRWMRDQGYDAPKSTPSGDRYLELEQSFLQEARDRGIHPAKFDLAIWNKYSGNTAEMVM